MDLKDLPETITRFYPDSGFTELYPPQAEAIACGLLDGASLVVATPTASGKTLLAEFAMLNSIYQGGKCLQKETCESCYKYQKQVLTILYFGSVVLAKAVDRASVGSTERVDAWVLTHSWYCRFL